MKSNLFFLGAALLLLASCSNELDMPRNKALVEGKTPLSVNVLANPSTKALVNSTALPEGSKIGVKLVKSADGSAYDNQTYNNIFYSSTDGTTWAIDGSMSILLSATEGKAYAYYPYSSQVSDFKAIPISSASNPNDQVDYMYGNVATGLKNSNPTASFTMSHAMAIVNFEIAKGSYTGAGAITSVKMKGNTASNTGTMNAEAGTVTATNKGYEFVSTSSLTLGNSSTGKFIVVPSGESSQLDFKVVMDGQTYTASTTTAVTIESGKVYKYTLTMSSTGLTVNTVTVTPWGTEQDKGSLDTELYKTILTWDEAKTKDGVYGMMTDGKAMVYEAASTTSESLTGVALVMNGKAFEIASSDASTGTKWAESYPMSEQAFPSSHYITQADGTNSYGYLKKPNGTYHSDSNNLSDDISTWTDGALADVDGNGNTERILAANVTIASVIKNYNDGSHGDSDWYLPAAGQLAYMFMNYDKINNLLPKVSGTAMLTLDFYWSSSVYSANNAWYENFGNGRVDDRYVTYTHRVRLVRDL